MNHQHFIGVVQSIIIGHSVWRGSPEALADITLKAMGTEYSQTDLDEIRRLLRSPQLRTALNARDCALWVGSDGMARLVDLQPLSLRAARMRLAHNPGPSACHFCLMSENPKYGGELVPELDHQNHQVAGSMVHPACANAFRRLRLQVAAAGETNE